jgi:hypothetical protein
LRFLNKNSQYYLKQRKTPNKSSQRAPRIHQENTKSSSKASLLLLKRVVALWQQYYKRENGEEEERAVDIMVAAGDIYLHV